MKVTLRLLLGASEGCITNGVMITLPIFYNRTEIGQRISWTFQCFGIALIISGFLSFGVSHIPPTSPIEIKIAKWQLLSVIYVVITIGVGIWWLVVYPDNIVKARFLTREEKEMVVKWVRGNQSGTETKVWKREQVKEALRDGKTWIFFLLAAVL